VDIFFVLKRAAPLAAGLALLWASAGAQAAPTPNLQVTDFSISSCVLSVTAAWSAETHTKYVTFNVGYTGNGIGFGQQSARRSGSGSSSTSIAGTGTHTWSASAVLLDRSIGQVDSANAPNTIDAVCP
jgi:hypothetical protein